MQVLDFLYWVGPLVLSKLGYESPTLGSRVPDTLNIRQHDIGSSSGLQGRSEPRRRPPAREEEGPCAFLRSFKRLGLLAPDGRNESPTVWGLHWGPGCYAR